MRRILSYLRRAADDYAMIGDGDRICVGLSGGKDSLTLLCALARLRLFYPHKFELCAVTLDMGLGADWSGVAQLCADFGIEYTVVPTDIAEIVFDIRKEKNPCSLCANLRRGILHDIAIKMGFRKIALGHHHDDVVETFMMNLMHEGRLAAFAPVTYLDRRDVTLIRPMVYAPEKEISRFAAAAALPVVHNPCPANGHTERQRVKDMLADWERSNRGVKHRIFNALQKGNVSGFTMETKERDGASAGDTQRVHAPFDPM